MKRYIIRAIIKLICGIVIAATQNEIIGIKGLILGIIFVYTIISLIFDILVIISMNDWYSEDIIVLEFRRFKKFYEVCPTKYETDTFSFYTRYKLRKGTDDSQRSTVMIYMSGWIGYIEKVIYMCKMYNKRNSNKSNDTKYRYMLSVKEDIKEELESSEKLLKDYIKKKSRTLF